MSVRRRDQRGRRPAGSILPCSPGDGEDLGAVGEELGRAALVGLDVGGLVAEDGVVALAQRGERQRVGRGAVEDEEDLAVGLEELAQQVGGPGGPGVVAVGGRVAGALAACMASRASGQMPA